MIYSNRFKQLSMLTSGGIVFAGLCELLVFSKTSATSSSELPDVAASYKYLATDPQILEFLARIRRRIPKHARIWYLRIVSSVDEMVGLIVETTSPLPKHIILAEQLLDKYWTSWTELRNCVLSDGNVAIPDVGDIEKNMMQIKKIMQSYQIAIRRLVPTVHA